MSGLQWIVSNADWLSAVCGILAAIVFAWPLLSDLPKRRYQDQLSVMRQQPPAPVLPGREDDRLDVAKAQSALHDQQMGGYQPARMTVLVGLTLLLASFVLALIYALSKQG